MKEKTLSHNEMIKDSNIPKVDDKVISGEDEMKELISYLPDNLFSYPEGR